MMQTGAWYYIGNDEIMLEVIQLHAQNTILHPMAKDLEVIQLNYDKENWEQSILLAGNKKLPDIIFFDFQPIENDDPRIKSFLMLCNLLKRNLCTNLLLKKYFCRPIVLMIK